MASSKRIAMLVPEFPNQTHAFFWREIQAIEEAGCDVTLLSTRRPAAEACPHAFRDEAVARTSYVFPPRVGGALAQLLRAPGRVFRALAYLLGLKETSLPGQLRLLALIPSALDLVDRCRAEGVSHVHIHSCANAAHLGALAHILGDLRYSLTLHGTLAVYGQDHAAKMARAAFVSAVTRPLSEAVQQVRPGIRAPVIMMGVDCARFCPASAAPASKGPFTVISVARLNMTKGHRFFLRAMAQLRQDGGPEVQYCIAGEGPARPEIEAEIASLGLQDQVTLLGSVAEDQVLTLLQGADALALTSIGDGEAAPVAVMEAMACGLPVICSIIGGTPDMIESGRDGLLVPQEDVPAITQALHQLAADPARAAQIGAQARASALALFDYRANAARLLEEIRASRPEG